MSATVTVTLDTGRRQRQFPKDPLVGYGYARHYARVICVEGFVDVVSSHEEHYYPPGRVNLVSLAISEEE